jgi:hypothetical protein
MNQLNEELEQHKDELIDKHWDINVNFEWWDYTYSEYKIEMQTKGITIDEMNFTGFYSQGDGASFTGKVDMIQFLKVHGLEEHFMGATFFAGQGELWAEITRGSSRYSHENSVTVNLIIDSYNNYEDGSTRYQVYETMQEVMEHETKDLEKEVEDICKEYMRDLYAKLRDEYESLTSKEAIWDTIVANDLHVLEAV